MTSAAAARVLDPIHHSSALLGFAIGAVAGAVALTVFAVVAVATAPVSVGVTGVAAVVTASAGSLVGWTAVAAAAGGILGEIFARVGGWNIETGVLTTGVPTVFLNGRQAITIGSSADPCWLPLVYPHGPQQVVEGSGRVLINCSPMSRVDDALYCDATIASGSPNIMIGGPKHRQKGTDKSLLSYLLPRFGFVLTATTIGVYPASALGSTVGVGLYQADYDTYQKINASVADHLGIEPSTAAVGVEFLIGLAGGNLASKIPGVGSWNSVNSVASNQAYQRYVARKLAEGKPLWSPERWFKNWHHLNGNSGVRVYATAQQRLNASLTSVFSVSGLKFGAVDVASLLNNVWQKGLTADLSGCADCDGSWHESVEE